MHGKYSLEKYLIECCSPTLASLKAGSLFNCKCGADADVEQSVDEWNRSFEELGVRMTILRRTETSALIYVFRESSLGRTLNDPEIRSFLTGYGYKICSGCSGDCRCAGKECDVDECLAHLRVRISGDNKENDEEMRFPHEIGVFLDYPLCDVKGFINNQGKNCKYTGIWKVYGDENVAKKTFARYRKCSCVYNNLWKSGRRSILQLTVAG